MFITLRVYTSLEQVVEISNNPEGNPEGLMIQVKELDDDRPTERLYLDPVDIEDLSIALKHALELVKKRP